MRYVPCGNCDDDVPVVDAGDEDAIVDFCAALLTGDTATARVLMTRALGDLIDTTRIQKLLADHARRLANQSEKSS